MTNVAESESARLARIDSELALISKRNLRVELDKAWEVSIVRRGTIAALSFAVAALLLRALGNPDFLRNALLPALGYILSTLTLPAIKKRWIARRLARSSSD